VRHGVGLILVMAGVTLTLTPSRPSRPLP